MSGSNPNIEDLDWLEASLNSVFCRTRILPDGRIYEVRYLVDKVDHLKIIVRPKEHPPPHFHVISNQIDASFSVKDCEWLKGKIRSDDQKRIEYWHKQNRKILVDTWNKLRPDDCPVGKIIE